jgi:hypothetical protein
MQKYHVIYRIDNTTNGRFYIGKHSTNNINDNYLGSGKALLRAIRKYGKDNFKKSILFIYDNEEDALAKEKELVNEEFVSRKETYNITEGGKGSWSHVKHLVPARDTNGKVVQATPEQIKNGSFSGINKDTISVYDKDGNCLRIPLNDERIATGEVSVWSKGTFVGIDSKGNMKRISNNDPEFTSGIYTAYNKNTIVVKDSSGNSFVVKKNDPRFLSGDLKGIAHGNVTVVDAKGNKFVVKTSDPRYISGELQHVNTGKKRNMKMYFWNNGIKNTRCESCPGEGWARGRIQTLVAQIR